MSFPMMKASLAACFVLALGAATAAAGNSAPGGPGRDSGGAGRNPASPLAGGARLRGDDPQ